MARKSDQMAAVSRRSRTSNRRSRSLLERRCAVGVRPASGRVSGEGAYKVLAGTWLVGN